jgi:hypothetical protein
MSPFSKYIRTIGKTPAFEIIYELLPNKLDYAVSQASQTWYMTSIPRLAKQAIATRQCEPSADERDPM